MTMIHKSHLLDTLLQAPNMQEYVWVAGRDGVYTFAPGFQIKYYLVVLISTFFLLNLKALEQEACVTSTLQNWEDRTFRKITFEILTNCFNH